MLIRDQLIDYFRNHEENRNFPSENRIHDYTLFAFYCIKKVQESDFKLRTDDAFSDIDQAIEIMDNGILKHYFEQSGLNIYNLVVEVISQYKNKHLFPPIGLQWFVRNELIPFAEELYQFSNFLVDLVDRCNENENKHIT